MTAITATGPAAIPARAGIGLRAGHYRDFLEQRPAIGWLEVHPENFFAPGGRAPAVLERVREDYPLSLHGVGLSPGSSDPLDHTHLDQLKQLIARFEPGLVSEHLSWGSVGGVHVNDLLPLPYTEEALAHMIDRIGRIQDHLGRSILVENVSSYLEFTDSRIPEWEFITELAARAGCGILLDVNNVYVNARNHGFDAASFLDHIPAGFIGEIHLAGHSVNPVDGGELLIDTHSRPVCEAVWVLYERLIERIGPHPTLIEWDQDLPALPVLLAEAERADAILEPHHAVTG